MSKYGSFVAMHENQQEMSDHVGLGARRILEMAQRQMGSAWVKKVILFRDGVGDGQISYVVKHEVKRIEEMLREVDPEIKLCVIIVNKRINSQFFVKGGLKLHANELIFDFMPF